jgi:putative ABC transport system permease protein
MYILLKLIFREAYFHRARLSLAVIATAAMSAMLVWLIGSIGLIVLQFDNDGEHYLGNFHAALIPVSGNEPAPNAAAPPMSPRVPLFVEQKVIDELNADALVMQVAAAVQIRNTMAKYTDSESILRRQRAGHGLPMGSPIIIGIDTDESPFELESGKWFNSNVPKDSEENDNGELEGVIGTAAANSLTTVSGRATGAKAPSLTSPTSLTVGDYVAVKIGEREFKIKITGLVEQKLGSSFGGFDSGGSITPAVGAVYVSKKTAEKLAAAVPQLINEQGNLKAQYLYIRLRDGANVAQFKKNWTAHLAAENIKVKFIDADDIQNSLDNRRSRGTDGLMGSAGSMSSLIIFTSLVSILIVFTALSMGVSERTRVFAMLRTVGMERRHIVVLIFGESVILCLFGWLGGIAAGWLVLQATVWIQPELFGGNKLVVLSSSSVITSGIAALLGSLLAAILPAWRGAKIAPLEGMNRGYVYNVRKGQLYFIGLIGAVLLIINPLLIYYGVNSETSMLRLVLYSYIGLPTQILGLVLLTPAVILLTEKFFVPLTAKILCIEKNLLKNQLSANLWRTMGTAVALSIGLGVYAFLEISGYSMLVPFTHSDRLPNTLVAFLPKGLPLAQIDTVKNLDGVNKDEFLPIALEQPLFPPDEAEKFKQYGMSEMQANAGIVVFGLDIEKAFSPNIFISPSTFSRNVFSPSTFSNVFSPSTFSNVFSPSTNGAAAKRLVDIDLIEGTWKGAISKLETGERYCIIPDSFAFRAGLHIGDKLLLDGRRQTADGRNRSRNRQIAERQESPLEYEVCGIASIPGWLWMAKLSGVRKYGYRSGAMMFAPYETVKNDFKINDAAYFWFNRAGTVSDEELENALQKLADDSANPNGLKQDVVDRPMVKLSSHEYLNDRVNSRADQVIQAAAKVPLILLMISSLGMMGTVAASIRTRRFELGVLRCLGITRCGLVRLILAEAILIAIAASIISIGFGVIGAWCFIGLMRYVSFFGGFVSPLTIPWYYLSLGFGATLFLCGLAAVLPAVSAGRTEPADLVKI